MSLILLIVVVYVVTPLLAAVMIRGYLDFTMSTQLAYYIGSGLLISLALVGGHTYKILARPDLRTRWKILVMAWVVIMPAFVCSYQHVAELARIRAWQQQAAPIPALGGMARKKYGEWRVDCVDSSVDDTIFQQWIPTLVKLGVENLSLRHSQVSDRSMAELATVKSLRSLVLTGTAVGDRGIKMLIGLPNLEVLVLSETTVTDEGVLSLSSFPKLKRLHLNDTSTSNKGLNQLMKLSSLRYLDIGDTKVNKEGKDRFLEVMPKVSVIGPYIEKRG